jgi:hypothetical protein
MRINLNLASEEELTQIDGVDTHLARSLIETRRAHGGFRGWDDVRGVPGMDELSFQLLKRLAGLDLERDPDDQLEVPGDVSGEAAAQRVLSSRPARGPA